MGLSFLAPLFLAGLLAIGVPVLVHLVHRERQEPLRFPSLMFLRRVPFRSAKRQRIRNWLLFLMRCAAIILIATAFARPWLERPLGLGGTASGGKDVVILLDRSYSMSREGVWRGAQAVARDVIDSLDEQDRVAVVVFGGSATALMRLSTDRGHALLAVEEARPGAEVTRYAPALKLAASLVAQERRPAQVVLISDFQQIGWAAGERVELPQHATLLARAVGAPPAVDLAISGVTLERANFAGRDRVIPTARVVNYGATAARRRVVLEQDERVQQVKELDVPARNAAVVTFDPVFASQTTSRGTVRLLGSDAIAINNTAHFVLSQEGAATVRLISNAGGGSFYLERALRVAEEPRFELHRSGTRTPSAPELQQTDVLVFIDTPLPQGEAGQRLEEFLNSGGGVIVIAAENVRAGHPLLPGNPARMVERANTPATIVSVAAGHAIFEPFRQTDGAQFANARILRYRRIEPNVDANVLARFDDGAPALLERRVGKGRVLLWAAGLGVGDGDLVLQPVFVPFMHQLVRSAAASAWTSAGYTVGQPVDVNNFAPSGYDATVSTPSGAQYRFPASEFARTLRAEEPGFYQVRPAGLGTTQLVAVNVDARESDLAPLDPLALDREIIRANQQQPLYSALSELTPLEREREQIVWWYLLLIAFALLAIETVFGNRLSRVWHSARPS